MIYYKRKDILNYIKISNISCPYYFSLGLLMKNLFSDAILKIFLVQRLQSLEQ